MRVRAAAGATPDRPRSVVVVGAGIVGASTVFYLTRRRDAPAACLIDGAPEPAAAASGKAGGFLARDWSEGSPLGPLASAGFDLHVDLAAEFGPDAVGYRRVEAVSASFPPVNAARKPAPAAGSNWFYAPNGRVRRLGSRDTTAQVHPRLLTRALVAAAVDRGATTRFNTTISTIEIGGDGAVTGVVTNEGETVPADAVVVAAGPWTGRVTAGGAPVATIDGQRAHSIVLTPATPVPPTALFSSCPRPGRPAAEPEFYPRPDGTVYVCGESDNVPLPARAVDVTADETACAHLRTAATAVAPTALGDGATVTVASQACYLPLSTTGLPAIGATRTPGLYVAAGHSCWGVLCGPITGRAMAELVVDGAAECVDLGAFAPR